MKETIKELFYGNIIPFEKSISSPEIKSLLKSIFEQREKLASGLNKEQMEMLEGYDNLQAELSSIFNEEFFVDGFTLGAKLIKEVLDNN